MSYQTFHETLVHLSTLFVTEPTQNEPVRSNLDRWDIPVSLCPSLTNLVQCHLEVPVFCFIMGGVIVREENQFLAAIKRVSERGRKVRRMHRFLGEGTEQGSPVVSPLPFSRNKRGITGVKKTSRLRYGRSQQKLLSKEEGEDDDDNDGLASKRRDRRFR